MKQLNHRAEQILLSLKKFDYLTRDQLNKLHRLGSVRNTNRILKGLEDYLNSFRDGFQSIYYLNALGREYVGCTKVRKKTNHALHIVNRNEFWLWSGCPSEWKNEVKVGDGEGVLVCDSWYKNGLQWHFLEVDLSQPMKENRKKAQIYAGLHKRGAITKKLGHFPKVVFLTTTELRRKQLEEACQSFPSIIYTLSDIK